MQFMPATWAIYGHGSIHRPRNAILAAGRFLAARGAARSIGSALYAYNPSGGMSTRCCATRAGCAPTRRP